MIFFTFARTISVYSSRKFHVLLQVTFLVHKIHTFYIEGVLKLNVQLQGQRVKLSSILFAFLTTLNFVSYYECVCFFTVLCTVNELCVNSEYLGHEASSERFLILAAFQRTNGPTLVQRLLKQIIQIIKFINIQSYSKLLWEF